MLVHSTHDPPAAAIQVMTLGQLARSGDWRLKLVHDRPDHIFVWITRGQGVGIIDGARRGLGLNNAVFVPARHLMALDLGRQVYGQAIVIPPDSIPSLPDRPQHLRVRDVAAQAEMTGLFDAIGREQAAGRPLQQEAIDALVQLITIWMHRQIGDMTAPPRPTKAQTLSRAFCARLVTHFASGASLTEHASILNVTTTHLTRVCKAEIGKPASAILAERQLHAARRLLTDTKVPAKDIARHLGFGSAAYFTRFVQQHTGHTPSHLRRQGHSGHLSG